MSQSIAEDEFVPYIFVNYPCKLRSAHYNTRCLSIKSRYKFLFTKFFAHCIALDARTHNFQRKIV